VDIAHRRISDVEADRDRLVRQEAKAADEVGQLRTALSDERGRLDELHRQLRTAEAAQAHAEADRDRLNGELTEAHKATERAGSDLADERRRVEGLHRKVTEAAKAQAKAETERDGLRDQVAELRRMLAAELREK
jgi:chromosome segregation ATPase